MEPEQVRSSVIARLVGFNELDRPLQYSTKHQSVISDKYLNKSCIWDKTCLSRQDQEKKTVVSLLETHKREKQPNGLVPKTNRASNSGFFVSPSKEMFCAYVQKPSSFASKRIIDVLGTPPHMREKGMMKSETGSHSKYGRRVVNPKLKHQIHTNRVYPKTSKKGDSLRCLSSLTASRDSHPDDSKARKFLLENKWRKKKKLFNGGSDTLAAEVKLKLKSSRPITSKGENDNLSYHSGILQECQTRSEEGNQPSPISVLESMFNEQMPDLNFLGVEQQLKTLKSEFFEAYSEGLGMVVSSDDESDKESFVDSEIKQNKEDGPIGSLRESWEFSYIADVLAEADLGNREKVYYKWGSVDLPISLMVFEKLEKQYSKQVLWKRSERRLLFDRINSSLVVLLESGTGALTWKKSVSRRLRTVLSTQVLKEELQKLLVVQEKRVEKEAYSAKVPAIDFEEWSELQAYVDPLVCELEVTLVDELLSEFIKSVG